MVVWPTVCCALEKGLLVYPSLYEGVCTDVLKSMTLLPSVCGERGRLRLNAAASLALQSSPAHLTTASS